ncbi:hypothetical protein, partial [Corynebacterium diphtheriae]|uniref:hypothetical protein n=1 Tax=Corynebacterium diphtheriae TaxID=1717 RepID=UPI0040431311
CWRFSVSCGFGVFADHGFKSRMCGMGGMVFFMENYRACGQIAGKFNTLQIFSGYAEDQHPHRP